MKLLNRIKFVFKYNILQDFIVYSIPDQSAIKFTNYDDAKKFADNQLEYRPAIMVKVEKV